MKNYNSREAMRGQPRTLPPGAPQHETGGGPSRAMGFTKAESPEAGASWWTWRLMQKRRRVGMGDCNKNKTRGKGKIRNKMALPYSSPPAAWSKSRRWEGVVHAPALRRESRELKSTGKGGAGARGARAGPKAEGGGSGGGQDPDIWDC